MADEQEKPVRPRGRGLQVYGWLVFALGFVFFIIGVIFIPYVGTSTSSGLGAALGGGFRIISFNALGIGVLLLITGLTFLFVGKSQGKKQKNQNH